MNLQLAAGDAADKPLVFLQAVLRIFRCFHDVAVIRFDCDSARDPAYVNGVDLARRLVGTGFLEGTRQTLEASDAERRLDFKVRLESEEIAVSSQITSPIRTTATTIQQSSVTSFMVLMVSPSFLERKNGVDGGLHGNGDEENEPSHVPVAVRKLTMK